MDIVWDEQWHHHRMPLPAAIWTRLDHIWSVKCAAVCSRMFVPGFCGGAVIECVCPSVYSPVLVCVCCLSPERTAFLKHMIIIMVITLYGIHYIAFGLTTSP